MVDSLRRGVRQRCFEQRLDGGREAGFVRRAEEGEEAEGRVSRNDVTNATGEAAERSNGVARTIAFPNRVWERGATVDSPSLRKEEGICLAIVTRVRRWMRV